MDVLNECLDTFGNLALSHFLALILSTDHLIASERFPKHCDKRAVSREKHGVCWLVRFSPPGCNIQPNQCFACSRHAGDEADELVPILSRLVDQLLNTPGGD